MEAWAKIIEVPITDILKRHLNKTVDDKLMLSVQIQAQNVLTEYSRILPSLPAGLKAICDGYDVDGAPQLCVLVLTPEQHKLLQEKPSDVLENTLMYYLKIESQSNVVDVMIDGPMGASPDTQLLIDEVADCISAEIHRVTRRDFTYAGNTPATWERVKETVAPLLEQWFECLGTELVTVCDERNNPPETVNKNELHVWSLTKKDYDEWVATGVKPRIPVSASLFPSTTFEP